MSKEMKIVPELRFPEFKNDDLMKPLDLGWKQRSKAEIALMQDLAPQLKKLAQGREISGLAAYE
jgi:type I restriction enzyme R subunit